MAYTVLELSHVSALKAQGRTWSLFPKAWRGVISLKLRHWNSPKAGFPSLCPHSGAFLFQSVGTVITKYHKLGRLINNSNLFLTDLEARKKRSWHRKILCLVRAHFLLGSRFLTITSHDRMGRTFSPASLIRALIPFVRAMPS